MLEDEAEDDPTDAPPCKIPRIEDGVGHPIILEGEPAGWHGLPVEIGFMIVREAVRFDLATGVVVRFVCHQWKAFSEEARAPSRRYSMVVAGRAATQIFAAIRGRIEVLQWLRAMGVLGISVPVRWLLREATSMY